MKSYKETLNLPKTSFPMKGNLANQEPKILKKWKIINIYHIIQNHFKNKKYFFLQDGPPYANGNIHIGHAVNKILKDIIIKSKILSGFSVPYTLFWDCHGLPIEHKIEKKIEKLQLNVNSDQFRHICQKYALKQVKKQKKDFNRLGIINDSNNIQLTMNPKLEANVIHTLCKIIQNKHLYRGLKPVHWCLKCQSALAEAEVEYHNIKTQSIIVMFTSSDKNNLNKIFPLHNNSLKTYIIIWTTTPWSLPANRAIAVHPNFKYQLIQLSTYHIIIAKNLVQKLIQSLKIKKWKIIYTIYGKELNNLIFIHPFLKLHVPIILSQHVTCDIGTGAVHIAPDYGEEDYLISKKYGIEITNIINNQGNYINNLHPKLNGKNIFQSNHIIIKLLKKKKSLFNNQFIKHTYPHCWRHKTPIIYRTTKQWFIKIQNSKLIKKCLKTIKKVQWMPHWGYNNMCDMIMKRPDWCISRQRKWGIPITLFIHKKTGELHPNTINIMKKIKKLILLHGSKIWWNINKKKIIGDDYKQYKKSKDILDVWFESGCIQNFKLYKLNYKDNITNMYLEGSDQYRGWFMSSLIIANAINKKLPYQEVLTHGFVIDKTGQKMSKSLGNTITPNQIIKIFGADILRLWVASTNYTHDMIISHNTIKQISEQYRRIRNTMRFLLSNIYDFDPKIHIIKFSNMIMLDQWILSKTKILQTKIIHLYNRYKFHTIVKKIIHFCSKDMGSFYFDIIKDRQYTTQKNSLARRSSQTAMHYILHILIRWIMPLLPFTAHEIWNYLPNINNKLVFNERWFNKLHSLKEHEYINNSLWSILINIKIETNKIIEKKIKKKEINHSLQSIIILYVKHDIYTKIIFLKKEIKFMLLVSQTKIRYYEQAEKKKCYHNHVEGIKIQIKKYLGSKCSRCWHYFNKINITNKNKNICNRCNKNIYYHGEKRKFL